MNSDPKDIVCEGIQKVNETLDIMMTKVVSLKEYHSKHTNSVSDTEILFLMTDPLYFQCKVLEMEMNFWKEMITRFSHRVYADFFKFLKSLYDHDDLPMKHVFYKDLCFDNINIDEILSIKKSINIYIEMKKNDLEIINNKIFYISNETERGVNVQSILNSENYSLKMLQSKIKFWEDVLNSHSYYHKKFLTSLKLKVLTMHTEMSASMDIDTYDASETLKMDENEEKQIEQSMNVSRPKPKRRWTISNLENFDLIIDNKTNEPIEDIEPIEPVEPLEDIETIPIGPIGPIEPKEPRLLILRFFKFTFVLSFICVMPAIYFGSHTFEKKGIGIAPQYYAW